MVAESYYSSNLRGTSRSRFVYNAASPANAVQLAAAANEILAQTPSGTPTQAEAADVSFGFGNTFQFVNKFSMRLRPLMGQKGALAAPFYSDTVVGDGLLKATQPGFEGGAGPAFTNVDVLAAAGVAARLTLTGTALRWYGAQSIVAVPGVGEVSQGVGFSAFLFARLSIPITLADQSFFIGGLADVSGALASGPDPSAGGLSGAMAIVKLVGDPTWSAFARAPGSAVPTKVGIGPVVATGVIYQFLIETNSFAGAVRFTVLDDAGAILGQTVFGGASFGGGSHHYHFDVGAFTGVVGAREFDMFSMSAVRNDSFKV